MLFKTTAWPRLAPFLLFMLIIALNDDLRIVLKQLGVHENFAYFLRALGAASVLAYYQNQYIELFKKPSITQVLFAVLAGIMVLCVWLLPYPHWLGGGSNTAGFLPYIHGEFSWAWVAVRIAGAALVVPLMEELFWRSFLLRRIQADDFLAVPPAIISTYSWVVSSALFALAHRMWLAAFLAGLIYSYLYRLHQNLWSPIIAHAATNGLLGIWVVATHRWSYW